MPTKIVMSQSNRSALNYFLCASAPVIFALSTSCEKHKPDSEPPEAKQRSGPTRSARAANIDDASRAAKLTAKNERTNRRETLESLALLSNDELQQRLKGDAALAQLLADIEFDDIDSVLADASIEKSSDDRLWQTLYLSYLSIKAKIDPRGYVEWVLSTKQNAILGYAHYLGANDPELGVELIDRSEASPNTKAASYNSVFQAASGVDPHRAVRVFNSTKFETSNEMEMALVGTFGFNPETATPASVHDVVSGIPNETLNYIPKMVKTLGGLFSQRPTEEVLAMFPLDRQPWERTVAISYLEKRAYLGRSGDVDVGSFLDSDKAAFLSTKEIDRLNVILGR